MSKKFADERERQHASAVDSFEKKKLEISNKIAGRISLARERAAAHACTIRAKEEKEVKEWSKNMEIRKMTIEKETTYQESVHKKLLCQDLKNQSLIQTELSREISEIENNKIGFPEIAKDNSNDFCDFLDKKRRELSVAQSSFVASLSKVSIIFSPSSDESSVQTKLEEISRSERIIRLNRQHWETEREKLTDWRNQQEFYRKNQYDKKYMHMKQKTKSNELKKFENLERFFSSEQRSKSVDQAESVIADVLEIVHFAITDRQISDDKGDLLSEWQDYMEVFVKGVQRKNDDSLLSSSLDPLSRLRGLGTDFSKENIFKFGIEEEISRYLSGAGWRVDSAGFSYPNEISHLFSQILHASLPKLQTEILRKRPRLFCLCDLFGCQEWADQIVQKFPGFTIIDFNRLAFSEPASRPPFEELNDQDAVSMVVARIQAVREGIPQIEEISRSDSEEEGEVEESIDFEKLSNGGILLLGFPQNLSQAKMFENALAEEEISMSDRREVFRAFTKLHGRNDLLDIACPQSPPKVGAVDFHFVNDTSVEETVDKYLEISGIGIRCFYFKKNQKSIRSWAEVFGWSGLGENNISRFQGIKSVNEALDRIREILEISSRHPDGFNWQIPDFLNYPADFELAKKIHAADPDKDLIDFIANRVISLGKENENSLQIIFAELRDLTKQFDMEISSYIDDFLAILTENSSDKSKSEITMNFLSEINSFIQEYPELAQSESAKGEYILRLESVLKKLSELIDERKCTADTFLNTLRSSGWAEGAKVGFTKIACDLWRVEISRSLTEVQILVDAFRAANGLPLTQTILPVPELKFPGLSESGVLLEIVNNTLLSVFSSIFGDNSKKNAKGGVTENIIFEEIRPLVENLKDFFTKRIFMINKWLDFEIQKFKNKTESLWIKMDGWMKLRIAAEGKAVEEFASIVKNAIEQATLIQAPCYMKGTKFVLDNSNDTN